MDTYERLSLRQTNFQNRGRPGQVPRGTVPRTAAS